MSEHYRTPNDISVDQELSVRKPILSLICIWNISQTIGNDSTYPIDPRTACYWVLRVVLNIILESDGANILSTQRYTGNKIISKSLIASNTVPYNKNFYGELTATSRTSRNPEDNILTISEDLIARLLNAVMQLAESSYFQPLNEDTVNAIVTMAQAASTIDLDQFSPEDTSNLVAELAHRCVDTNKGCLHLGMTLNSLKIIFEKMGHDLSLKGLAMFVKAVNNDNPYYSPDHNILLAKAVQQWAFWARYKRRNRHLEPEEFFLLGFMLSKTVSKTALFNVNEGRIEFIESIKLYLKKQNGIDLMIANPRIIHNSGLRCGIPVSEVQFLMFNHTIYGWCSSYGAGVKFSLSNTSERTLLWQQFELGTIQRLFDKSVSYIQRLNWSPYFGVSRLQFASSTLECIIGIFRHADLFNNRGPTKHNFQIHIVSWITQIITAITLHSGDRGAFATIRDISGFVSALSSTKRAVHSNGYLPFENGQALDEQIERILDQQLLAAIELSEDMFKNIELCFRNIDAYVKENHERTITIVPSLSTPMTTKYLHTANALVNELITRTVKGLFASTDFLLQLISAGRHDLAAVWLFVVKKIFDTYSAFRPKKDIWYELSETEQEVFKRNILISTINIDQRLRSQDEGTAPVYRRAKELNLVQDSDCTIDLNNQLATLRWLSDNLAKTISGEITQYHPTYGDPKFTRLSNQIDHLRPHKKNRINRIEPNSFEQQVFRYVRDYLNRLKYSGSIKYFELQQNIRLFKCEIDLVIEVMLPDGTPIILLLECEGESWHSTFGVRNPLDVAKLGLKTSHVLWKLIGVTTIPNIVTISYREFKSNATRLEQKKYVESLIANCF
jgi:hypothetical protein